jgi:hypothetical protein
VKPIGVKKEYQMKVDFTIRRKLNDVIKKSFCWLVVLATGTLSQFLLLIFKPWLPVQGV